MKLATFAAVLAISAPVLSAQQPPRPPAPPAPVIAAPAPRPMAAPAAPMPPIGWDGFNFDFDLRDVTGQWSEVAAQAREAARVAVAQSASAMAMANGQMAEAQRALAAAGFGWNDESFSRTPPAPWAQGDPADSLYRVASEALNRGDYRRAADLYGQVRDKFPRSEYFSTSVYYQAFALYRIGTTDELRVAYRILSDLPKPDTTGTPAARRAAAAVNVGQGIGVGRGYRINTSREQSDVQALLVRIRGALAARGDQQAAAQIAQDAQKGGCDREDVSVRIEALNALGQMDPASATPLIRRVLESKEPCTELKRQAMLLLVRRSDSTAANALLSVARSPDQDLTLRTDAIAYLGRLPGDNVVSALEDLLRTSNDESIQRAALGALASSDNPRAHQSLRALIERPDASEAIRIDAINRLVGGSSRMYFAPQVNFVGGQGVGRVSVPMPPPARHAGGETHATSEDVAFLRALYPKLQSERLKTAVLDALGRVDGADNQQFLLTVARNTNESSDVRASAISRLTRTNIAIADLAKLYDAAESRSMRMQVINALAQRTEPEAIDKLGDIAKTSTDADARRSAISALSRKKDDPRAARILSEIVVR